MAKLESQEWRLVWLESVRVQAGSKAVAQIGGGSLPLVEGESGIPPARFAVGDDPLGPYKATISDCLHPDIFSDKPVRVSEAKRAISAYSKAVGDPPGEAELMTFFVECGNDFTLDVGDMDEAFYNALNRVYRRAIDSWRRS